MGQKGNLSTNPTLSHNKNQEKEKHICIMKAIFPFICYPVFYQFDILLINWIGRLVAIGFNSNMKSNDEKYGRF